MPWRSQTKTNCGASYQCTPTSDLLLKIDVNYSHSLHAKSIKVMGHCCCLPSLWNQMIKFIKREGRKRNSVLADIIPRFSVCGNGIQRNPTSFLRRLQSQRAIKHMQRQKSFNRENEESAAASSSSSQLSAEAHPLCIWHKGWGGPSLFPLVNVEPTGSTAVTHVHGALLEGDSSSVN